MDRFDLTAERERLDLAADCERCFGLCCVAPGLKASDILAFDKLPGKPCRNLLADFGCGIHDNLVGINWRQAPETAELMFQVLPIVRQLNELLWFITEALDRTLGPMPARSRLPEAAGPARCDRAAHGNSGG